MDKTELAEHIYNIIGQRHCHECRHAEQVPGSAHTRCTMFGFEQSFLLAVEDAVPTLTGVATKKDGTKENVDAPLIIKDPIGVEGGWANWPIDFDPKWITCYLNVDE